jgi:hypothetical protein
MTKLPPELDAAWITKGIEETPKIRQAAEAMAGVVRGLELTTGLGAIVLLLGGVIRGTTEDSGDCPNCLLKKFVKLVQDDLFGSNHFDNGDIEGISREAANEAIRLMSCEPALVQVGTALGITAYVLGNHGGGDVVATDALIEDFHHKLKWTIAEARRMKSTTQH